jgi:hypothetical protein
MKRPLTYEEVNKLIAQEDQCGINNCLQEIFSIEPRTPHKYEMGIDYNVIGDFNEQGELGDYEVIDLTKE